jgi:NAD binding domain of 6-phosphogluconate dehydrogenase
VKSSDYTPIELAGQGGPHRQSHTFGAPRKKLDHAGVIEEAGDCRVKSVGRFLDTLCQAALAKGATDAARLRDIAGCAAVLTSLPDDHALTEVTLGDGGLIHVLTPGAIHISMSTVSPGLSRRLAQQHGLAGQGYVAAPVLGNPDLAQARKLFILAGLPSAVARISPVLQRLGQHLFLLGDDAGNANLMKLAGNVLTALTLQGMGRGMICCRSAGAMATYTLCDRIEAIHSPWSCRFGRRPFGGPDRRPALCRRQRFPRTAARGDIRTA